MDNYVVIDSIRYDFVSCKQLNVFPKESCSEYCCLAQYCDFEDTPCSVFNASKEKTIDRIFTKHSK